MRKRTICLWATSLLAAGTISVVLGQDPPHPARPPEAAPPRPDSERTTHPSRGERQGEGFGPRRALPPEQLAEVMEFAKKYMPDLHEQLVKLQKDDPARARVLMRSVSRLYWEVRFYPENVLKAAVERHRANIAIFQARREYGEASPGAERDRIVAKLRELLGTQFEQDVIVKKYEIERLEKHLAELKQRVDEYQRERDTIIKERLERLLAPPPPPGTPPPPPPGTQKKPD